MEPPEIVNFARNFATMVRVKGPDPKGLKMRNFAFHHHHSGITTLSASGFILPVNLIEACEFDTDKHYSSLVPRSAVVISVASVVEPFLARSSKESGVQAIPELIPYAQIHVMAERKGMNSSSERMHEGGLQWFDAQILRLVDVPASSLAVKSLIGASSSPSSELNWDIGWSLASLSEPKNSMQNQKRNFIAPFAESDKHWTKRESKDPLIMGKETTRIIFLLVPEIYTKDLPEIMISPTCKRGNFLLAVGSPFGILSPVHFFNSVSAGSVANCYPSNASDRSLLMADIHCLPGMEGAPVFGDLSNLIGLVTRPLRHSGGAQVQLVIPWEAIQIACSEFSENSLNKQNDTKSPEDNFYNTGALVSCSTKTSASASFVHRVPTTYHPSSTFEENLLAPVCIVSLNDGVWASGVVLNNQGLILTNAHLFEPWRYGGTTVNSNWGRTTPRKPFVSIDSSSSVIAIGTSKDTRTLMLDATSLDHMSNEQEYRPFYRSRRQVSVRLDHLNASVWCDAKVVYIGKGALDVSLLQIESVPFQLCPVNTDTTSPAQGSKAYIIGHGLFGPSCGLFPSISGGVVAKVVKTLEDFPAMIETTAAVHPGGSGGAVFNSAGHMIGLVTSNAKHGGGTIIPHLNFSIPSAALEPIFKFAKDMENTSLLDELDKPIKELSSVWAMTPPLPPKPDVPPPVPETTEEHKIKPLKGSRFAKFMAERQPDLFRKDSSEMTTARKILLPRDTGPSKL